MTGATKAKSTQMSFRDSLARRKQLEVFAIEDGYVGEAGDAQLTPILRECVAFYVSERLRKGKDAVRLDFPKHELT